jgi:RNA polymerase sigma factor (TIGR02999 family)
MARALLRGERQGHTLQTTALVNEVYLRLAGEHNVGFESRGQFFAFAGSLMRRILIDYARRERAVKRGGEARPHPLDPLRELPGASLDLETAAVVSEALGRLQALSPRQSRVIELRHLVGLELEEVAEAMGISRPTVVRELRAAKLWLARELAGTPDQRARARMCRAAGGEAP